MNAPFDPGAPAGQDSGIFGLTDGPDEARVHVIGVPFEATTSYGRGTARGPEAVLAASRQVDLYDLVTGTPYEAGICMLPIDPRIAALDAEGLEQVAVARAGGPPAERARDRVNAIGDELNAIVHLATAAALDAGRLPAVLGGDHSVPFGAVQAAAERFPGLGVLHFDAHADLRRAYEGFTWSHASILHNVVERLDVARLVQVGLRDLCEEELDRIRGSEGRIAAVLDPDWARARFAGRDLGEIVRRHLDLLPEHVWVTFDVDGLDPSLCPNTGTPVPGGLLWHEAMGWLEALADSGRRVVGLDLNEVDPGPEPQGEARDPIDAIVGARLLYRLIGTALRTGGNASRPRA